MDLHLDLFGYRPAFSVTSMVGLLFHLHHDAGLRTLCEAFFTDFQPVGPNLQAAGVFDGASYL